MSPDYSSRLYGMNTLTIRFNSTIDKTDIAQNYKNLQKLVVFLVEMGRIVDVFTPNAIIRLNETV